MNALSWNHPLCALRRDEGEMALLLLHRLIVFPMLVYSQQLAIKKSLKGWGSFFLSLKKERMEGRTKPSILRPRLLFMRSSKKEKKKPSGIERENCVLNFFLSSIWPHPNMILWAFFFHPHWVSSKNSLLNFLEKFQLRRKNFSFLFLLCKENKEKSFSFQFSS